MEMVTRYGMNETVGQRTYAPTPPQPLLAVLFPSASTPRTRQSARSTSRCATWWRRPTAGDRHSALAPCRSRRRRPPAADARGPDRRSIPSDPSNHAARRVGGLTRPLSPQLLQTKKVAASTFACRLNLEALQSCRRQAEDPAILCRCPSPLYSLEGRIALFGPPH
jgi:hypothetical protein